MLKTLWFDAGKKLCYTCMYIDEYAFDVHLCKELPPHGYDGTCLCCKHDENLPEDSENRLFISPCWKACSKWKKCTIGQATYEEIYDDKQNKVIPNPYYKDAIKRVD